MYIVREIFRARPGKAGALVKKFKQAAPFMENEGMGKYKIMTDISGPYWTVVMEMEVPDLTEFAKEARGGGKPVPELEKIMEGYHDLVEGGYREIYLLEE